MALLLTGGGLYALTTAEPFALDPATISLSGVNGEELYYTDPAAAHAAMGIDFADRPNLFRLRTAEFEQALETLPQVRRAWVRTALPDTLRVTIEERVPVVTWRVSGATVLADVEGRVFAPAPIATTTPVIQDMRTGAVLPPLGGRLAQAELEVARLLGAVGAAELGTAGGSYELSLTDAEGWVIEASAGWRALFGHYSPTLRPPSMIATQVACLRDLLAGGEDGIAEVTLSLSVDTCGTFVERPIATRGTSPAPTVPPAGAAPPTRRP